MSTIITTRSTPRRLWTFDLDAIDELARSGDPAMESLASELKRALMTASQIEVAIDQARART
jgi:hypothetical protein